MQIPQNLTNSEDVVRFVRITGAAFFVPFISLRGGAAAKCPTSS
jgi:hypothetical protein